MNYHNCNEAEFVQQARIPISVLGEDGEVYYQAALDMLAVIEQNNSVGKETVMIVPVGPVKQYPIFVRLVNERRVSLKTVTFLNMDEYLRADGSYIDVADELSFRGFMQREVYGKLDPVLVMPEANRLFPDPENLASITKFATTHTVDACFGGIGINGHIAFNEPEAISPEEFLTRTARVIPISPETLVANAMSALHGDIEVMPRLCVTIGMQEIFSAKQIRLYCFRDWHRAVIRRAACGEITAQFPATLLQRHADARITIPQSLL